MTQSSERLRDFFFTDHRARRRIAAIDIALAGSATAVLILMGKINTDSEIAWSAALLASGSFAFHLWRYVTAPSMHHSPVLRSSLNLAFATGIIALLAAVEVWLKKLAGTGVIAEMPISPDTPVPPPGWDTFSTQTKKLASAIHTNALEALNAISKRHKIADPSEFFRAADTARELYVSSAYRNEASVSAYVAAKAVPLVISMGPRAVFTTLSGDMPGLGVFLTANANAFIRNARIRGVGSADVYPTAVERSRPEIQIVIYASMLEHCKQAIDGIVWIEVTFIKCKVIYSGGAIALANVRFVDCIFDSSFSIPNAPPVGSLLSASNGSPVSYSSDLG